MKRTLGQTICSILLFAFALTPSAFAQEAPLTFESSLQVELSLKERMIHRRAVEAAVWGMPLMNFKAMRDALKEAGSGFNDVAYFSQIQDWKFQIATPNCVFRSNLPLIPAEACHFVF